MTATSSSSRSGNAPTRSGSGRAAGDRTGKRPGRVRWRRIPGRVILAACFLVGAVALLFAVIPFTTTVDDVELRCGPAVFEVLMPADPAFDDIPENALCADPARTRLIVSGATIAVVLVVAGITEWRTRRGSHRRDARWLASSPSTKRRMRQNRSSGKGQGKGKAQRSIEPTAKRPATTSLPPSRS